MNIVREFYFTTIIFVCVQVFISVDCLHFPVLYSVNYSNCFRNKLTTKYINNSCVLPWMHISTFLFDKMEWECWMLVYINMRHTYEMLSKVCTYLCFFNGEFNLLLLSYCTYIYEIWIGIQMWQTNFKPPEATQYQYKRKAEESLYLSFVVLVYADKFLKRWR